MKQAPNPSSVEDPTQAELEDLRQQVEQAGALLVALREELELQGHQAGLRARAEWDEVSRQLAALQARLREVLSRGGDQARLKLHLGRMELCQAWYGAAPYLQLLVGQVRGQEGAALHERLVRVRERFASWLELQSPGWRERRPAG